MIRHFGDGSFQPITCTGTDNPNNQERKHTNNTTQKEALVNSTIYVLKRNLG